MIYHCIRYTIDPHKLICGSGSIMIEKANKSLWSPLALGRPISGGACERQADAFADDIRGNFQRNTQKNFGLLQC